MNANPSIKTVKSAIRTMMLFSVFAEAKRPLTLGELSRKMDAPKSSCHELVQTLAQMGYLLLLDGGKSYYPSRRLWEMAEQIYQFNPIKEKIHEQLRALRDQTGETVFIGRLQGLKVVYVEVFDGTHTIRYTANSGDLKSIHASALGKALLGELPENERNKLITQMKLNRFNEHTITKKFELKENILACKENGLYVTKGEHQADVMGLAIPVTVQNHLLAVGLAGPIPRIEHNLRRYGQALSELVSVISR
ncbi:IclR family transcriptional regulator [Halioxenophilus sp. WMMB6]|uniref:IclR family transcriptional regulator n=1 Tax=Halioxenophilus sp. WMMB6 TaxID=3073815 RepID=UPI00295E9F71|nr:IclR family transcriptional regulator [Halioxenophilus sp. WMMB6]